MPDEIEQVLASLDGVVDPGEPVDELSHALQAAGLAEAAGADDELVVAALLHDVARSPLLPDGPHDRVGARWLAPRLGERVAWLVGAHVQAKRWLVATDDYPLSAVSTESLRTQGGATADGLPLDHPWWPAAVRLRRFDDAAKIPGAPAPTVADVLRIVARLA
ncbi:HD domain-containing protein [Pseudonocardia ailaonensis]|uniref:HD domain-containing protein n=1 Tax=Pseudonocardia ailaonensis TaxID=367279 RepID=A0ABN2N6W3_9PSEU